VISRADLEERVGEWGLRHGVVEKDYVLGWLLWGIGSDELLGRTWAFKGGTSLHKCYVETYRFSEDLDFTVMPEGPVKAEELEPVLLAILGRVADASGLNFSQRPPLLKTHSSGKYTEGRVYYTGPLAAPQVAAVKLDLSSSEQVVRPTVFRKIAHAYPDELPGEATVRCYSFEEVFAEKIRAMGERGRSRDLFDIVNLFRRRDSALDAASLRAVLTDKCQTKGVPIPTLDSIRESIVYSELEAEWVQMLSHQLPALPPVKDFWDELPNLFAWLAGTLEEKTLGSMPVTAAEAADEEVVPETGQPWRPSARVQVWGQGVPLEVVRFAAVNHLLVNLRYNNSWRHIEPYCLRRTRAGNLLLHAVKSESGESRSYRVDKIQKVEATNVPFAPRYQIEFNSDGPLAAPQLSRRTATLSTVPSARPRAYPKVPYSAHGRYFITCPYCQKRFRRDTPDTRLNAHKTQWGSFCTGSGKSGYLSH